MAILLAAPLGYWRVHHPVKKQWDFVLPLIGAVALTGLVVFLPNAPSAFGPAGYIVGLQNLYAILGGFFVAALTLVATADSKSLSSRLAGFPATTFGTETAPITRRRFLCLLFGYLAFSSFALYVIGFFAGMLAPSFGAILGDQASWWLSLVFLGLYNFWLCHTFVATLVGLYYFTDRLQRPDVTLEHGHDPVPAE